MPVLYILVFAEWRHQGPRFTPVIIFRCARHRYRGQGLARRQNESPFGPFSDDVADAISDAKFVGDLTERSGHLQSDGSPFSIFQTSRTAGSVRQVGSLEEDMARQLLTRLKALNATALELAATIHWLKFVESDNDWRSELKRRKGSKTDYGRMEQAGDFLAGLGFELT